MEFVERIIARVKGTKHAVKSVTYVFRKNDDILKKTMRFRHGINPIYKINNVRVTDISDEDRKSMDMLIHEFLSNSDFEKHVE